eukprot:6191622-Pleurochrysis_carterae.AAC.6
MAEYPAINTASHDAGHGGLLGGDDCALMLDRLPTSRSQIPYCTSGSDLFTANCTLGASKRSTGALQLEELPVLFKPCKV